jgi:hypothetical protein
MNNIIEILGNDISSIILLYLLPNKQNVKINYDKLSKRQYHNISHQYYYFKCKQKYGDYTSLEPYIIPDDNMYVITYKRFTWDDELFFNGSNIYNFCGEFTNEPLSSVIYICFYIHLSSITYSDILKTNDKDLLNKWVELKRIN